MANKKINELDSRSSLSLSDLMAVGDPSTGYLYKTTISDLKTLTGAGVISFNGRFGAVSPAEGDYTLTQLSDVIITSATNGNILQYNGSNWVNVAAADLSGFVPYTGATSNVNLGTYDLSADILNANDIKALTSSGLDIYSNSGTHIALMGGGGGAGTTFYGGLIGTTGSFSSSGGSNTFSIEHSSGSGIALSITKGGNGEGIYVNKTGGSGNAATIVGTLEATTLVKTGGTSSQFLKADGSVDSSTYLTTSSAASTYVPLTRTLTINGTTYDLSADRTWTIPTHDAVTIGTANGLSLSGQALSLALASTSATGALSSTDWNTFNGKQAAGNYVTIDTTQTITADKTFNGDNVYNGVNIFNTYQARFTTGIALNNTTSGGAVSSHTVIGANVSGLQVNLAGGGYNNLNFASTSTGNTYTFPNATGTIALTSDLSSYLPLTGGTLTGALNINLASGTGINVAADNVVIRSNTGVGSPRQLVFSMGGSSSTFLDAKGYGANYITDFGIRTYNSSGTAFNVFYGTSAGLVGIGTTAPLSKLHVTGTGTVVRFGEESGTTGKQLLFGIDGSTGTSEIQSVWQGTANTTLALNPAGGNVAIGASTAASKLTITGSDSGTAPIYLALNNTAGGTGVGGGMQIQSNGTSVASLDWGYDGSVFNSNLSAFGNLVFKTNGSSERMRITSSGNVGIGTSSPSDKLTVSGRLNLQGLNQNSIWFNQNAGGTSTGFLVGRSFTSSDTQDFFIYDVAAAVPRLTISSGGQLFVGGTLGLGGRIVVFNDGTTGVNIMDSSANGQLMQFNNSGAVSIGSITTNGSSTSFNTTSDHRLKEDLKEIKGLEKIGKIKVYDFKWKNSDDRMDGVIAHELAEVIPYAVNGKKDGEQMQGVDYSKIVPILVKAIQEQQAQIEQLKAK
jgi:hypothetical protein